LGAVPVVGDVYDAVRLARLVAESEAEVVIHQLTAFGTTDGDPYAKRSCAHRRERNLVSAARGRSVRRFIAQSISFMCSPFGSGLTDEETPLHLDAPLGFELWRKPSRRSNVRHWTQAQCPVPFSGTAGSTALEQLRP